MSACSAWTTHVSVHIDNIVPEVDMKRHGIRRDIRRYVDTITAALLVESSQVAGKL